MTILSWEDARNIERDAGLASGAIACDREMSEAEQIYLSVPPHPMLAAHIDFIGGDPLLVVYEQEIGGSTKDYMQGAVHASGEDAANDIKHQWAGLAIARQNGMASAMGEDIALTLTGWSGGEQGGRWSWSVDPSRIRNIFQGVSRWLLMLPQLADLPPEEEGGPSPGRFIRDLGVKHLVFVHSIRY